MLSSSLEAILSLSKTTISKKTVSISFHHIVFSYRSLPEAAKKGGGVRGVPQRKKELFFLNMALLAKNCGEILFVKIRFRLFYTKKKSATKPRGGGVRALVAWPLRKNFF